MDETKKIGLIKKIINNIFVQNIIIMAGIGFSFLVLDLGLRIISNEYISFYGYKHYSPLLFSISYIFLFMGIIYLLPKKGKIIFYSVLNIIFNVIVFAQMIHLKVLDRFFGISDIFLASEANSYFKYAIKQVDEKMICLLGLSIGSMIITNIIISRTKEFKRNRYYFLIVIVLTIGLVSGFRYLAFNRLGEGVDPITFDASVNPRNVYDEFNNQSKNVKVAGIYEQTFRSIYLYIKDSYDDSSEVYAEDLDEYYSNNTTNTLENKYTGIFKGKNVIFIQLESIDSWLVNKEVMPTLTSIEKEGWNFTSRYSPAFSGGQTINSEFAAMTGLYSVDNSKAIYNFDSNDFSYSVPSLFTSSGYDTESIHANKGSYYNRNDFHLALGFNKHFAVSDLTNLNSYDYYEDSSLIKDDNTYSEIVKDNLFMSLIVSYSAHIPYDETNDMCVDNPYNLDVDGNKELSCIRNLAHETDEMLRLLIEKLEEEERLDDTVLVLYTDHYTYGYSDQDYVFEQKDVDNANLVQNVPFVIWSSDIKSKTIKTVMDTADIAPTVLNLFGIEYDSNNYIGTDVFSKNHEKFVYFSDGSWYDGNIYYDGTNKVTEDNKDYIEEITKLVKTKIDVNNKIILSDYFSINN